MTAEVTTSITAFARVLSGVSLWPAFRHGTAVLLVAALLLNMLLGPNAMPLADFGDMLAGSGPTRLALVALWTVAMVPAARKSLFSQGIDYLRWLPHPRWLGPTLLFSAMLCLHGPLGGLLAFAGQPLYGLFFFVAAATGTALLLLPTLGRYLLVLGLWGGVWLAASPTWQVPMLCGLSLVLFVELRRAWRDAPARSRLRVGAAFAMRRWPLCTSLLLYSLRREGQVWIRSLLIGLLGALGIASLAPSADYIDAVYLVASTPFLAAISVQLALSIERGHQELLWLRLALGVSGWRVIAASLCLLGVPSIAASLAFAASSTDPRLWSLCAVHGLFWAFLSLFLAASARFGSRAAMLAVLALLIDILAIAFAGAWAIALETSVIGLFLIRLPRRMPKEIDIA